MCKRKFTGEGRRLTKTEIGSDTISYTYNIDGIRTSKTVGTETTEYFLEGSTVIAQKTGNNVLWFLYDADGQRIGFTYNDTPYLYVYNATGDVVGIVDDTLTMVVEYTYSPWGEILSTTGDEANTIGVINPFRYRGYYYDEETGLYYLNARYYDPETGRFINADVLVDGRTLVGYNLFAYCLNNPINYSDYNGNFAITAAIAGAFAQAVGITLIAILTYQVISYYLETPSGRLFTQSIADAMAGVADSVQNFASSNSREEEKENERDIALPKPKKQAYFPLDPSRFHPKGLYQRVYVEIGTGKNGGIIKWEIPGTRIAVFEWNEDYNYRPHYHVLKPEWKNSHNGAHYFAGSPVPEPWNSLYF